MPKDIEDDFKDPYGPRLGKTARFWRVYVQEANISDDELSQGWNQMLDVMLLFVCTLSSSLLSPNSFSSLRPPCFALFALRKGPFQHFKRGVGFIAATIYRFILDSLKYLKPDQAERTTHTLMVISQTLIAMPNRSTAAPVAAEAYPPNFTPPKYAIIINTLWFLSLMLGITVTLISILAKEWCHVYTAGRTGPMHEQARRRQQRFDGLKTWRMVGLIAFLPTLMHVALFLFAIGLSIYLWHIYAVVAIPVIVLTSIAALFYSAVTILPFVYEFCPYSTALSRVFINLWLKQQKNEAAADISSNNVPMDIVTSRALSWVISNCENSNSVEIALQAIAGADHSLPCEPLWSSNAVGLVRQRLHACFTSQQLPVTNSGFESLVKLGPGSLAFRLCILYARVLNVLAWGGTKDGWNQSINVFRDVWSEFELLYDNLSKYSDSEISPSTTVGYAGISVWKQHRPYIISNFSKGTNSPLGVSSYILLVLERHRNLPSYEAQLFELLYVLQKGLVDHNTSDRQSDPVYKRNLVANLVLILKHLPCDSLLSDFNFVPQVLAAAGLILNGHHSPSDSLADKIGRYAEFDRVDAELLLFLGLVGLIEASESTGATLGEDTRSTVELEVVFDRLIQLKTFLVSNTQGSWPPSDLPLPFPLGSSSTFNDYALEIISAYYRRHANAAATSQLRCVGLAGGLIVANVVGNDCILDHWGPVIHAALPAEDPGSSLRWSYPNTSSHAVLQTKAPFLDVAFCVVLSLMRHKPKQYAQRQCLAECFHDIAGRLQRVSSKFDELIVNELLEQVVEDNLFDVLVYALLTIRHDCPAPEPWRGIYAEPKLAWWGARIIWFAHQSVRRQDGNKDGGGIMNAIEGLCHTELGAPTTSTFELVPETNVVPEYSTEKASSSANSFTMRLAQFKSVLLGEIRNPSGTSELLDELPEPSEGQGLKRSWGYMLQRTRRKLSIRSPIPYAELV
ncbi:hypothetical protein FRC06_004490 [Ceratobasidium sp. 370]|nr:hypothetical protein FRC06_004490 [Ceratobasidium sp. 370]